MLINQLTRKLSKHNFRLLFLIFYTSKDFINIFITIFLGWYYSDLCFCYHKIFCFQLQSIIQNITEVKYSDITEHYQFLIRVKLSNNDIIKYQSRSVLIIEVICDDMCVIV